MTPDYWDKGKTALKKRDKILGAIITAYHGETLTLRGDAFYTLARAIAGQQISVKAADSVWAKLMSGVRQLSPNSIANADATLLRSCGLSASKVIYMHALANHFLENQKRIQEWPHMHDDDIIAELTSIKGIGRWTAEMFLIFGLGRPDVFPIADLGLLKGIYRHYNQSNPLSKAEVLAIAERWKPYRTIGTWYMWRALDPVPVEY